LSNRDSFLTAVLKKFLINRIAAQCALPAPKTALWSNQKLTYWNLFFCGRISIVMTIWLPENSYLKRDFVLTQSVKQILDKSA
jgi:hypothetical protein